MSLSTDVTFVPFGPEAGDDETTFMDDEIFSLGPFTLETPLVFYLQQQNQLYVRET